MENHQDTRGVGGPDGRAWQFERDEHNAKMTGKSMTACWLVQLGHSQGIRTRKSIEYCIAGVRTAEIQP
jgi:hypothetical protein